MLLNTAKDLKDVIGSTKLNVLESYSPSLDGGTALSAFIASYNKREEDWFALFS